MEQTFLEQDTCAICLTIYYQPIILSHCKHIFCRSCIEDTFFMNNNKCPLCRAVFDPNHISKHQELEQKIANRYPELLKEKQAALKNRQEKAIVKLLIGNTSHEAEIINNKSYHKWLFFVQAAEGERKLEQLVEKIQIELPPIYQQNLVVFDEAIGDGVHLKGLGNHTFQIGINVYWKKLFTDQITHYRHNLKFEDQSANIAITHLFRKK